MKTSLAILTLFLTCLCANGQTQLADSEIAKTMQVLADTTIIVQYPGVWNSGPQLYLISKKGDTINTYLYQRPPYRKIVGKVARGVANAIVLKEFREYRDEPVGINRYFTIIDDNPDTLRMVWNDLLKLQLWRTKDDAIEGSGCPVTKSSYIEIDDGGGVYILLITRGEIKPLNFYAPSEFERFCPGRKGRQTAIKLSRMVCKIFKKT